MQLKLIDTYFDNTNESDYDTAVDLVHYESSEEKYTFESASGLQIVVSSYYSTTRRSYLEPDFDEMDEDYKNGKIKEHYPYKQHDSQEKPEHEERFNFYVALPWDLPILDPKEMESYIVSANVDNNYDFYNQQNVEKYNMHKNKLLNNLYLYDEDSYIEPNYISVEVSDSEIKQFLDTVPNKINKGTTYEITLSENLKEKIDIYESQALKILEKNRSDRIINEKHYEEAVNNINHQEKSANEKLALEEIPQNQIDEKLQEEKFIEELHKVLSDRILNSSTKKPKDSLFGKIKKFFS